MDEDSCFASTFESQNFTFLSSKERLEVFKATMESVNPDKPLILSAWDSILEEAVRWATTYNRRLHVNQITTASQVEIICRVKERNPRITSDTTVYQLFLAEDREKELQTHGMSGLPLPTSKDQEALWNGIRSGVIDMISLGLTPLGTLGIELTLPLLLHAASARRLPLWGNRSLFHLLHHRPKEIFGIDHQATSPAQTEINLETKYSLDHTQFLTPCDWIPFEGLWTVGKLDQVVLGATVESKYRKGEYIELEPRVIFKNGEVKYRSAGGFLLPSRKGAREHDLGADMSGISPSLQGPSDFTPVGVSANFRSDEDDF